MELDPFVEINLDKPRKIKLGVRSASQIEDHFNLGFPKLLQDRLGFSLITVTFWYCMVVSEKGLTLNQVQTATEEWLTRTDGTGGEFKDLNALFGELIEKSGLFEKESADGKKAKKA